MQFTRERHTQEGEEGRGGRESQNKMGSQVASRCGLSQGTLEPVCIAELSP